MFLKIYKNNVNTVVIDLDNNDIIIVINSYHPLIDPNNYITININMKNYVIWKNSVTIMVHMKSNKNYFYKYEKHNFFVIFIWKNSVATIIDIKSTKNYS